MNGIIDAVMVLLMLGNLAMLGTSRLAMCIRVMALQGLLLGVLPLVAHGSTLVGPSLLLAVVSVGLRGIAFPYLLLSTLRDADVRREMEPLLGYVSSIVAGVMALVVSIWIAGQLPLPGESPSPLFVPVGLTTVLIGILLIISRKKALTQVVGYLVMENGIYVLGVRVLGEAPLLVELGVLLDAFVAVFVMSIATYRISREFSHIDVDQLTSLKG